MQTGSDRYVLLNGGLSVPIDAVLLVLGLESRGFKLSRDGADIFVSPFSKLTEDDRRALKLWKPAVLSLLDYEAPRCA